MTSRSPYYADSSYFTELLASHGLFRRGICQFYNKLVILQTLEYPCRSPHEPFEYSSSCGYRIIDPRRRDYFGYKSEPDEMVLGCNEAYVILNMIGTCFNGLRIEMPYSCGSRYNPKVITDWDYVLRSCSMLKSLDVAYVLRDDKYLLFKKVLAKNAPSLEVISINLLEYGFDDSNNERNTGTLVDILSQFFHSLRELQVEGKFDCEDVAVLLKSIGTGLQKLRLGGKHKSASWNALFEAARVNCPSLVAVDLLKIYQTKRIFDDKRAVKFWEVFPLSCGIAPASFIERLYLIVSSDVYFTNIIKSITGRLHNMKEFHCERISRSDLLSIFESPKPLLEVLNIEHERTLEDQDHSVQVKVYSNLKKSTFNLRKISIQIYTTLQGLGPLCDMLSVCANLESLDVSLGLLHVDHANPAVECCTRLVQSVLESKKLKLLYIRLLFVQHVIEDDPAEFDRGSSKRISNR